jgi:sulfonate transport system permease protein
VTTLEQFTVLREQVHVVPAPSPAPVTAGEQIELVEVGNGRARRHRFRVPGMIGRLAGPAALIALWWLSSAAGWIAPTTLPPPSDVIAAGRDLIASGDLQSNLWTSLGRVVKGLGLGVTAGLGLALLSGLSRQGENLIDSTMQVMKAIPNFALVPFFIVWMGIGEQPKVTLIALATSMPIYMNVYGAIRGVDGHLVEAARTLQLNRVEMIRHVVLPATVPGLLVGLRLALASAWLALIFAETINAMSGLGYLMYTARTATRVDIMTLILVVYAVIGLLSYGFVRLLERWLLAWRRGFAGVH